MNDKNFFLDILIPTYNRSGFLKHNLVHLERIVTKFDFKDRVHIIISNNGSSDGTRDLLDSLQLNVYCTVFHHDSNTGVQNNLEFVLGKSSAEYCMYLGDDDFIHDDYLLHVIQYLDSDKEIFFIVPSFYPVDENRNRITAGGRGVELQTKIYPSGISSVRELAHLAHQMSGLVYRREGLYDSYMRNNVNSLYPFIYFAALSCMGGKSLMLTQFPVLVTQVPQYKKDWDYGRDGLLEEKFKCYFPIFKNNWMVLAMIQNDYLWREGARLLNYLRGGLPSYVGIFTYLMKSRFVVLPIKLYIPIYMMLNPIFNLPSIARRVLKNAKE